MRFRAIVLNLTLEGIEANKEVTTGLMMHTLLQRDLSVKLVS